MGLTSSGIHGFRPFRAGKVVGVGPGARVASLGLRVASPGLYS